MKPLLMIWMLVAMASFSCRKKYTCLNETLIPVFTGYTATEIDSVIIKRFEKGNNFLRELDSVLFTMANSNFQRTGDTAIITQIGFGYNITDEYDYMIINPFDGKTVSITDAMYEIKEESTSAIFNIQGSSCRSPLISYRRDGTLTTRNKNRKDAEVFIQK